MGDNVLPEGGDGKNGEEGEEVDKDESEGVDGDAVCTGHLAL